MTTRALIMVFARLPEHGKVKTRLAESIGPDKALEVYLKLLQHTHEVVSKVDGADKLIFYTADPHDFDLLDYYRIPKTIQEGADLGARMSDAFEKGKANGYDRLLIIGSDCHALEPRHLEEALGALERDDLVLGPAEDGGYYLLGMNELNPWIFQEKTWSGPNVFLDTILDIKSHGLSYHLLDTLNDVDHENDMDEALRESLGI